MPRLTLPRFRSDSASCCSSTMPPLSIVTISVVFAVRLRRILERRRAVAVVPAPRRLTVDGDRIGLGRQRRQAAHSSRSRDEEHGEDRDETDHHFSPLDIPCCGCLDDAPVVVEMHRKEGRVGRRRRRFDAPVPDRFAGECEVLLARGRPRMRRTSLPVMPRWMRAKPFRSIPGRWNAARVGTDRHHVALRPLGWREYSKVTEPSSFFHSVPGLPSVAHVHRGRPRPARAREREIVTGVRPIAASRLHRSAMSRFMTGILLSPRMGRLV